MILLDAIPCKKKLYPVSSVKKGATSGRGRFNRESKFQCHAPAAEFQTAIETHCRDLGLELPPPRAELDGGPADDAASA